MEGENVNEREYLKAQAIGKEFLKDVDVLYLCKFYNVSLVMFEDQKKEKVIKEKDQTAQSKEKIEQKNIELSMFIFLPDQNNHLHRLNPNRYRELPTHVAVHAYKT